MKRRLLSFERARFRLDDGAAPDSTEAKSDRAARLECALVEAVMECRDDPEAMAALAAIEVELAGVGDSGCSDELRLTLARPDGLEGRQAIARSLREILTADE